MVRMTRSRREKRKRRRKQMLIAGMTGALSFVSIGLADLPQSTYAIYTDQKAVENSTFRSVFVFESTVNRLVEEAKNKEASIQRKYEQMKHILETRSKEEEKVSEDDKNVTRDVYETDQNKTVVGDVYGGVQKEAGPMDQRLPDEVQSLYDEILRDLSAIRTIVNQLQGYSLQANGEKTRVLLYVVPALQDAEAMLESGALIAEQAKQAMEYSFTLR
ncbi:exported hypothetical protein [[Clostridium] ultunense Esp]|nr:exported hypothetical protein [[Clostridium] ultunense Esp]